MKNKLHATTPIASHGAANGKWVSKGDGDYTGEMIDLKYLKGVTLPPTVETVPIYGDNRLLGNLIADQGYNGNIVMSATNTEWEIELGMKSDIVGNISDIKLNTSKTGALYYEIKNTLENKKSYTVKCWLLNVTVGKPEQSSTTDTNTISPNDCSYPITIMGEKALKSGGTEEYLDEDGMPVEIRRIISIPGDDNYKTFGDAIPSFEVAVSGGDGDEG